MYPVTELYEEKIKENNRLFEVKIQIQHSKGVLDITDKELGQGTLIYTESSQAGEDFTIGGTVASTFDIKLINKPEYANINFEGATIIPQIGLLLRENIDTENYFLSAPQPSEFVDGDGDELWEYVPLGRFNIDESKKLRNTIELKAIDNMINLDIPYGLSNLSYPATLYQIYVNICNVADVTVGTTTFPNKDYIVQERPEGDYNLRDMLGYVAELSGTFARMNRSGGLELTWYKDSGIELDPSNRFNFKPREDLIQIKGVKYETEDTVYLTGTDEYVVDLSENPLLQDNYNTVLPNIFNNIKDTIFTPFESNWQGNPAIQAGDVITQTDRDGNIFNTIVTNSTYKYRGASSFSGKGLPLKAKGYKGSTNKKIANIVRKEIVPLGDKLTTLEQAQLDATELIANMLGGYTHFESDAFYISDNPVLANSTKIWKWGIGGFGYSDDGGETYKTGITANGSIVAELVSAGIVTADMIQTGILQSEDGSSWLNLNNGEFNFKDALKWSNGTLEINSPQIDDLEGRNRVFRSFVLPKTPYYGGDVYIDDTLRIWICNTTKHSGQSLYADWTKVDSGTTLDLLILLYNSMVRSNVAQLDGEFTDIYIQNQSPSVNMPYHYIYYNPNATHINAVALSSPFQSPYSVSRIIEDITLWDAYKEIWKYSSSYPNIPSNFKVRLLKFTTNNPRLSEPFVLPPYGVGDLWSSGEDSPLKICIYAKNYGELFSEDDWILASNAVELGQTYNNVLISSTFGIQVKDKDDNERVRLGNYAHNKYGLLIKDSTGNKTILDEDGILQSWQEGRTDNIDTGKPLRLSVFVPSGTRIINQAILRFKRENFRAYSTSTASNVVEEITSGSGGGDWVTATKGNAKAISGDGTIVDVDTLISSDMRIITGAEHNSYIIEAEGHTHDMYGHKHFITHEHNIRIDDHYHWIDIPSHSHGINYGIYENTKATNINITINGTNRTSALGGGTGFNADQSNLNITPYLTVGTWNTIDISGTGLGRIDATVFIQALMNIG